MYTTSSLLLPLVKFFLQMRPERRKLVFEILPAPPTLHIPARPVARVKSLAAGLERELVQTH